MGIFAAKMGQGFADGREQDRQTLGYRGGLAW
jgi:hypothetical protein